jgi:hypothetical protein
MNCPEPKDSILQVNLGSSIRDTCDMEFHGRTY